MFTKDSWFPAVGQKGVIGRFAELEVLDIEGSHKAGYQITKVIPVLEERTLLSNDYAPKKLPKDPVLLKRFTDKYPEAWALFQGTQPQLQGTPLSEKFHELKMPPQVRQRYEFAGVMYWEQIADLSDAGCDNLGFGSMKMRTDVLKAMGKPLPAAGPNVQLASGMSAADAMAQMPGAVAAGAGVDMASFMKAFMEMFKTAAMPSQPVVSGVAARELDIDSLPQINKPAPVLDELSKMEAPPVPSPVAISASAAAEAAAEAAKQASRRSR